MDSKGMREPAILCEGVGKRFGGTQALRDISLQIAPGTIHALVGENGAGKSTLLGVLAGRIAPTEGVVRTFGAPLAVGDPRASRAAGIVAIYQELTIIPALSAQANVFLGQPLSRHGALAEAAMRARFDELAGRLGVQLEGDAPARTLSVADQQLLEIMRALQARARVILFDEPTAPLAPAEREGLFRLMRDLRDAGTTMIFVSHNLGEVLDLADAVTVFRDGRLQRTAPAASWTKHSLVEEMLGPKARTLASAALTGGGERRRARTSGSDEVLRADRVTLPGVLEDVHLRVARGEIVGVAGLVGSGRTSLLRALAGLEAKASGVLRVDGRERPWPRTVRQALGLGIAMVPEDRKSQGLVLGMTAKENVTLADYGSVARGGWISTRRMRRDAADAATGFGFDERRVDEPARNLSGGNQQKLLLARWAHRPPRVLLADEPTRGIDVGAKEEIVTTLRLFARRGIGVVIVSSELEEIVAVADRVFVLAQGRLAADLSAEDGGVREADILHAAFDVEERHVIA